LLEVDDIRAGNWDERLAAAALQLQQQNAIAVELKEAAVKVKEDAEKLKEDAFKLKEDAVKKAAVPAVIVQEDVVMEEAPAVVEERIPEPIAVSLPLAVKPATISVEKIETPPLKKAIDSPKTKKALDSLKKKAESPKIKKEPKKAVESPKAKKAVVKKISSPLKQIVTEEPDPMELDPIESSARHKPSRIQTRQRTVSPTSIRSPSRTLTTPILDDKARAFRKNALMVFADDLTKGVGKNQPTQVWWLLLTSGS
jgi:hypothetical protein